MKPLKIFVAIVGFTASVFGILAFFGYPTMESINKGRMERQTIKPMVKHLIDTCLFKTWTVSEEHKGGGFSGSISSKFIITRTFGFNGRGLYTYYFGLLGDTIFFKVECPYYWRDSVDSDGSKWLIINNQIAEITRFNYGNAYSFGLPNMANEMLDRLSNYKTIDKYSIQGNKLYLYEGQKTIFGDKHILTTFQGNSK